MHEKEVTDLRENSIKVLNDLLKGELSAVETYGKAVKKFDDHPARSTLMELKNQHEASAEQIRHQIAEMEGEPRHESGTWGTIATAIQSAANLLGKDSAVQSLETGEENGKRDYESALKRDDLAAASKDMISTDLLPRVLRNLELLQSLDTHAA